MNESQGLAWSYKIRVYNVRTGKQLNSIQGDNLRANDIPGDVREKMDKLIRDVAQSFKMG